MGRAPTSESHGSLDRCKWATQCFSVSSLSPRPSGPLFNRDQSRGRGTRVQLVSVPGRVPSESQSLVGALAAIFQKSTCLDARDLARSTAVLYRCTKASSVCNTGCCFWPARKSPTVSTVWRSHETCRDQIDLRHLGLDKGRLHSRFWYRFAGFSAGHQSSPARPTSANKLHKCPR